MNYFAEGLQGSGKSTLVGMLSERNSGYRVFREGDYSPVELAWCAYVSNDKYRDILEKYSELKERIKENSHAEGGHTVICYTRVMTDNRAFYNDLEQYEIYNGRLRPDEFDKLVLDRFGTWRGENQIFECSLFQNIVEDMMLFRCMTDKEIKAFYSKVRKALEGREYRILYLRSGDVEKTISHVRSERTDDKGNEVWFGQLLGFFDSCPYSRANGKSGADDLIKHLIRRQELEIELCNEIFRDKAVILDSKSDNLAERIKEICG